MDGLHQFGARVKYAGVDLKANARLLLPGTPEYFFNLLSSFINGLYRRRTAYYRERKREREGGRERGGERGGGREYILTSDVLAISSSTMSPTLTVSSAAAIILSFFKSYNKEHDKPLLNHTHPYTHNKRYTYIYTYILQLPQFQVPIGVERPSGQHTSCSSYSY